MKPLANKAIHLGLAASLLLLTQGCFFTRFSEMAYSIGCTEYYTDGSRIKDNVMYRLGDSYYIYAAEVVYEDIPEWYVLVNPRNTLKKLGYSGQYVPIALDSKAVEYLLEHRSKNDDESPALFSSHYEGKIYTETIDLSQAEIIPLERSFSHPYIIGICSREYLQETIHVRNEKTASSWLAAPLIVLGLAVDIPTCVGSTAVIIAVWPIILPIQLIYKCFK